MGSNRSIVFAAGGTGGHVSPAVALAEAWKKERPEDPLYILGGGREEEKDFNFPGVVYNVYPPQRPVHPRQWLALKRSRDRAKRFLEENEIKAVIATGGYASFPTLLAARSCALPYWLFEANQRMGRVVKLLGGRAVEVIGPLGCEEKKQKPLGNPVRSDFENTKDFSLEKGQTLEVLVSGGSGGAQTLDQRLPGILNEVSKKISLSVTHICRRDAEVTGYEMAHKVREPGPDFLELLNNCHVLLGRAGGSTIAECNAAGRPQVLVPLPSAKDDHQRANAAAQVKAKAAIVLEQSQSDSEWVTALSEFFEADKLKQAAQSARDNYPKNLAVNRVKDIIAYLEKNQ
jgi:UDP-N-acetylglucosamine--N-acetylmuramyl-(pentapeptide) pyrophosphoryl-undecaprenol N-acetylglucosamine transferase